jgi:hypothetical protein
MATGLKVPIGVNSIGGAALVNGDDNDIKIIKLALTNDDNENAFQQNIGLGEEMIFDLNDPTTRPKIISKLRRIFDKFEANNRFKLLYNTIKWEESSDDGELSLTFKYLNIESDEIKEFDQKFGSGV